MFTCALHGEYSTKAHQLRIRWDCPTCADVIREEQACLDQAWCRRYKWEQSGIPIRFRNRTFANWRPQSEAQAKVLAVAMAYVANLRGAYEGGRGILLAGDIGTGKSHLLAAAGHEIIRAGYSCQFVSVGELFSNIKRGFGSGCEGFDITELKDVAFLLVDDVGASRCTDWEVGILHELLRYRYDAELPTLLTTNESNLERAVGHRIVDRFAENMIRLTLAGPSQRSAGLKISGPDGIVRPMTDVSVKVCVSGQMIYRLLVPARNVS
jgi:DNA replication protein DnaC